MASQINWRWRGIITNFQHSYPTFGLVSRPSYCLSFIILNYICNLKHKLLRIICLKPSELKSKLSSEIITSHRTTSINICWYIAATLTNNSKGICSDSVDVCMYICKSTSSRASNKNIWKSHFWLGQLNTYKLTLDQKYH